ncbi:tRNA (N6-isopentenyl adenosine(37)-C2)-methylthiotransferase MiaB [Candidatus Uhrbacteria bacterium]|nr:tRNA (N6-isopentenyl adenosine(37)-C2)-methylthiotransferase MiaB [Candidatus Uhrbacteria bacterium]
MPGTYKITTFGCQMNKSDSERLQSLLTGIGMSATDSEGTADVLVYNTCSVRQTAEDRMYGVHRNLTRLKEKNPNLIVALTGCMAGRDKDGKIRERLPLVDLFFPTEEMVYLPKRLSEISPKLIDPNAKPAESEYQHYLAIKPSYRNIFQAYVAISNGCNKFCTYCVVPYSRGRQKDRPTADVLLEVRDRAAHGCLEVTILGQTVNLYNPPDKETAFSKNNPFDRSKNCFGALMWELNHIDGLERIHFTAPHPQYMDAETIAALALPKHVNYLHLPVQSGSNAVLQRMNRTYTREQYIDTIRAARHSNPDIAIGTDIIVGFCGETDQQFEETVSLYRECDFDIAYLAQYSQRSGTGAVRMYKDDVSKIEKKRRWTVLQRLMEETVLRKNQRYVGTSVEVLVESCDKGLCSGNSREMKRVNFAGSPEMIGTIVSASIDHVKEWILYGSAISH